MQLVYLGIGRQLWITQNTIQYKPHTAQNKLDVVTLHEQSINT
jgi:DNA-binding CsgD family transcriptional regulator